MKGFKFSCILLTAILLLFIAPAAFAKQPNIVLVMADDQGWGQAGYMGHPVLETPHLDAMAEAGLRFNRFYAAAPVCSPTRASVLTGRTPKRTGVPGHGHNLCLQEKTLPEALKKAGYSTGFFGKWHLNGLRGKGAPILGDDANHPGRYGFDEWLGVTNFFDLDPVMSRNGEFEKFEGDSSVVIVTEALEFMAEQNARGRPSLTVIWYGSPHNPQRALERDRGDLPDNNFGNHLGEIMGIDRSIGKLREGVRDLGIEEDTLIWYCSDNGGLAIDPDACGNLRGGKGDLYEGGIRVPGIVEWPGHIRPMTTDFPASTMDIMPTFVDLLDLPDDSIMEVHDGQSLVTLFNGKVPQERRPIPFFFHNDAVLIDGDFKLFTPNVNRGNEWALYHLEDDRGETRDLSGRYPERFKQMKAKVLAMKESVDASAEGKDYPAGEVVQPPRRAFWFETEAYRPHFEKLMKHPQYRFLRSKVPDGASGDGS